MLRLDNTLTRYTNLETALEALLAAVSARFPYEPRVELLVREGNARAIALYKKPGFRREGRFEGRGAAIPMAWPAPRPTQPA